MKNLITINESVYLNDIYIQEPKLCLPTCLAIIYYDLHLTPFTPFYILSHGKSHNTLNFFTGSEEIQNYYITNYRVRFPIKNNKGNSGCFINYGSLNSFLHTFDLSHYYIYYKNKNEILNERFYTAECFNINEDKEYGTVKDIINKLKSNKFKCYMIAFINYSKLIDFNSNEVNNHVVIINNIFKRKKQIELLIPLEDENVKSVIVSEEQFRNSISDQKGYYGYSILSILPSNFGKENK